jgi:hypothetical protein
MSVVHKSTNRKAKAPASASKKQVAIETRTLEKLERAIVDCLIRERADLPTLGICLLRRKEYAKLVALKKPITWSLVIRASAMRGKAGLEVRKDLITAMP